MIMTSDILNKNPDAVVRNLNLYNIVNDTDLTLKDLNISIFENRVFHYYKLIN